MKFRGVWAVGILAGLLASGALAPWAAGAEVKGKFERTLQVTGAANLDLVTGSGDIKVTTGDSSKVLVRGTVQVQCEDSSDRAEAEARLKEIEANPPIEQQGNSIRIGHQTGRAYSHVSIDYELVVPAGSELLARTGSGDLVIQGPLNSLDVKTGSGDAKIDAVKGSVRLTTGSGDVVMNESGGKGARIETGSGDVNISLPSEGGLNLMVRTGSGDISTGHELTIQTASSHEGELDAKVRGGGAEFVIRTGSGDVHIH